MKTTFRQIFAFAVLFGLVGGIESCTQSSAPPDANGSNVAMRTEADYSVIHTSVQSPSKNATGSIDSLQVTSAAFVASNFTLRNDIFDAQSDQNLTEVFIRPPQFLLAFDASGIQYIGEAIVPTGTYNRARFDIHPLQGRSDSLMMGLGPLAPSLLAGASGNSTIIIHGYIWESGQKMPFIYTSSVAGNGSVLFDQPLVVSTGLPIEIIVRLSTQKAFMDPSGVIIDPRDGRNTAIIEKNLRSALKANLNSSGS